MIASATPSAPVVAEEKLEASEALSPEAAETDTAPPGEEVPETQVGSEAPTEVLIYQEVPVATGAEPLSGIVEAPVISGEDGAIPGEETDTGTETLEAMPVIRERAPEGRPVAPEQVTPESRQEAPKGFTLRISDDAGNEMEVSLPEETEIVQDPFEVAAGGDGKISLKWSAKGNLKGFNILRAEVDQGEEGAEEYAKVNLLPIPFFASQSGDHGLVYHFKDAGTSPGKVYRYKVETIFSDGAITLSSPLKISVLGTENAN